MVEDDPLETQRGVSLTVTAELGAAGFEDAHEIGRGGFGVVYRCVQSALDRTVAVKVLTADLDEDNQARFIREQRVMGRLTGHPNIVGVLHVGTTDSGHPYIVMQYHPQDSLDARIRRIGPVGLGEALRLGVKMAGALETAHRLGILHRDVKPANILLSDYGEPALADFGIAHVAGGFKTATGTVTGSPAFTAPEVLKGEPASPASDVYSLGATLFCAVTAHAAFERHSGEQVMAQFLRITTRPIPDLREYGIPEDVCALVERAMFADPHARPVTAAEFGDELRQAQHRNGFPVDEMALHLETGGARHNEDPVNALSPISSSASGRPPPRAASAAPGSKGTLPLELTSFVGRRSELTATKRLLSGSRLVTLTGAGGVGKTRLGLRVAAEVRRGFADGVRLVELGNLRDGALVVDVVAAVLGVRDQSARTVQDVLVDFLAARRLLLVLDNCEQLVDAVAHLAETLLRACPDLRILATSREPLGIGGEAVLRVTPLAVPDPDRRPSLAGLPRYDAVTLFVQRAAAAVPGFELTEGNQAGVTGICRRLDGLPLPIELAAARLRAMSAEQILQRLTDRYTLLTLGNRAAPNRQQTLRLCVDWSHDLCTPVEQQVWARLSVFAGSFELDAAEGICDEDLGPGELLDAVASLVDKSILIREEQDTVVRFRVLETLRDYGRERSRQTGEHRSLRSRHRDWYQQLVLNAEAEWISSRQLEWIARLAREQPNLREAMEYCLSDSDDAEREAGLRIAAALFPFWLSRGVLSEGRRWLDGLLARRPGQPTAVRVEALFADSVLAEVQGDLTAGTALVEEARALAEQIDDPLTGALIAHADGALSLFSGDLRHACSHLESALEDFRTRGDLLRQVGLLETLGLAYGLHEEMPHAIACYEEVLAITEAHGESVYRSYSLWSLGVAVFRQGDLGRATALLEQGLRLTRLVDDPVNAATCLEALAWIAGSEHNAHRAAVLMGSAADLGRAVGSAAVGFPNLLVHHEKCEGIARGALGERAFETAFREGTALGFDNAIAFALGERPPKLAAPAAGTATILTKRERQVSDLVAEGLTNRAIAAKLVISQRTAQGHVENILTKLGFTSRAQIAAWVVEQTHGRHS
ncbi:protein kinase domain-containing protein [Rhodococcus opacus]|uniref:protein kinase domain-containing protein n=1 Tax=Rhodococcus opacus TaxID=37919 RepID=UPI001C48187E|nr:protein kinase [Rhodococcus opacus]MBV6757835.1 protein kinase [Rhodococcus opacus]